MSSDPPSEAVKEFRFNDPDRKLLIQAIRLVLGEIQHARFDEPDESQAVDLEIQRNEVAEQVRSGTLADRMREQVLANPDRFPPGFLDSARFRSLVELGPEVIGEAVVTLTQQMPRIIDDVLCAYLEDLRARRPLRMKSDDALRSCLEMAVRMLDETGQEEIRDRVADLLLRHLGENEEDE